MHRRGRERLDECDLPHQILTVLAERRRPDRQRRADHGARHAARATPLAPATLLAAPTPPTVARIDTRPITTTNALRLTSVPHASPNPTTALAIDSGAVSSEPVCIVGGTGALGFGLAVRLGRAGVPIVIGSRDAGRAQEAAARHAEKVPDGTFAGPRTPTPSERIGARDPERPVPQPVRDADEPQGRAARRAAARRRHRSPRRRGQRQGHPDARASGRARPPSRLRRWRPTASASCRRSIPSAPRCSDRPRPRARRGRADLRRPTGGQGRGWPSSSRRSRGCGRSTADRSRWRGSSSS